jgi:2-oxoisovalerate dehydrogenase E1 component beta subunit
MFDLDAPVVRVGGPDVPGMPFATPLEHAFMPDVERIYDQMRELAKF